MLILALAVIVNVLIAICFKIYARKGVDSMAAIVFNYVVCAVLGSLIAGEFPVTTYGLDVPWVPFAIALGFFFFAGFNVTALSVKFTGITTTAVMQRMSLLISAGYAIIIFGEPLGFVKLTGIVLAALAVILINLHPGQKGGRFKLGPYFAYPALTLLFSGIVESVLYYIKARGLSETSDLQLTTFAFSAAAVVGILYMAPQYVRGKRKFHWNVLVGGLALGVPNFFSIYFILLLLKMGYQGSVLFPVLNISVLAASALVGVYLFSEKVRLINVIGLLSALAAIIAIMLA